MVRYYGDPPESSRQRRSQSPMRAGYGASKRARSLRRRRSRSPQFEEERALRSDRGRPDRRRLDPRGSVRDPAPRYRNQRSDDDYSEDESYFSNYSSDASRECYHRPKDRYRRERDDDYRPHRSERHDRSRSPRGGRPRRSPPPSRNRRELGVSGSPRDACPPLRSERTERCDRSPPLPPRRDTAPASHGGSSVRGPNGSLTRRAAGVQPPPGTNFGKSGPRDSRTVESVCGMLFPECDSLKPSEILPAEFSYCGNVSEHRAVFKSISNTTNIRSRPKEPIRPYSKKDKAAMMSFWEGDVKDLRSLMGNNCHPFILAILQEAKRLRNILKIENFLKKGKSNQKNIVLVGFERPFLHDILGDGVNARRPPSPSQVQSVQDHGGIGDDAKKCEIESSEEDDDGFFTGFDFGGDEEQEGEDLESIKGDKSNEGDRSPVTGDLDAEGEGANDAAARAREARPDVDEDTTFNVCDYPLEDEDGADLEEEERKLAAEYLNANINFADMLDVDQEGGEREAAQPDAEGAPMSENGLDGQNVSGTPHTHIPSQTMLKSNARLRGRRQQQLHHLLSVLELIFKSRTALESIRRLCVKRLSETLAALQSQQGSLGKGASVLEQLNEPFPPWAAPSVFDRQWNTFPDLATSAYNTKQQRLSSLQRTHGASLWTTTPSPQLHIVVCPDPLVAFVTEHYIAGCCQYQSHRDKRSASVVPVIHHYRELNYQVGDGLSTRIADGSNTYDRMVEALAGPASKHEGTSTPGMPTIRDAVSMSYAYRRLLIDRFLVTNSRSVVSRHYHQTSQYQPNGPHTVFDSPSVTGLVAVLSGGWHDPEVDGTRCVATTPIDVLIVRNLSDITDQLPLARYAREMECVAKEKLQGLGRHVESRQPLGKIRFTGVYVDLWDREHMENVGIGCVAPALEACMIHRNRLYAIEAEKAHPKPPAKYFSEMFRSKHMFPLPSIFSDLAPLGNYHAVIDGVLGPLFRAVASDEICRQRMFTLLSTTTSPSPLHLNRMPEYIIEALGGTCPLGGGPEERLRWFGTLTEAARTLAIAEKCVVGKLD